MSEEKKMMIMCSTDNIGDTEGTAEKCMDCDVNVWLSESSIITLQERYPEWDFKKNPSEIVCLSCGFIRMAKQKGGVKLEIPGPEQIKELINHMNKKKNGNI